MGDRDAKPFRAIYWMRPGEHDYMFETCESRTYKSKIECAVRAELSRITLHGSGLRYFHNKWQEQKDHGGLYYAVASQSEIEKLAAEARARSAALRRSEEEALDGYTKPAPRPIDELPDRIRNKISIGRTGCWLWQGQLDRSGYGILSDGARKHAKAHRKVYECLCGPIPIPLQLRHSCHVRNCVNPKHLIPGTAKQNNQDKMARQRSKGNGK